MCGCGGFLSCPCVLWTAVRRRRKIAVCVNGRNARSASARTIRRVQRETRRVSVECPCPGLRDAPPCCQCAVLGGSLSLLRVPAGGAATSPSPALSRAGCGPGQRVTLCVVRAHGLKRMCAVAAHCFVCMGGCGLASAGFGLMRGGAVCLARSYPTPQIYAYLFRPPNYSGKKFRKNIPAAHTPLIFPLTAAKNFKPATSMHPTRPPPLLYRFYKNRLKTRTLASPPKYLLLMKHVPSPYLLPVLLPSVLYSPMTFFLFFCVYGLMRRP